MANHITRHSRTVAEFARNPEKAVRDAASLPVAVFSRRKLAFYAVDPKLFEAMVDQLDEAGLARLASQRLSSGDRVIPVELTDL